MDLKNIKEKPEEKNEEQRKGLIWTMLDRSSGVAWHFYQDQGLVDYLANQNIQVGGGRREYFAEFMLNSLLLHTLLKRGEGAGLYIDNTIPEFRLKLEIFETGATRALLMPHFFSEDPKTLNGHLRFNKFSTNLLSKGYTSLIELNNISTRDAIEELMERSFQFKSFFDVERSTGQSMALIQLGKSIKSRFEKQDQQMKNELNEEMSLKEYALKMRALCSSFLATRWRDRDELEQFITEFAPGLECIHEKEVFYHCGCHKQKFVDHILGLANTNPEELFEGQNSLEVACDYCLKVYDITRDDLKTSTEIS